MPGTGWNSLRDAEATLTGGQTVPDKEAGFFALNPPSVKNLSIYNVVTDYAADATGGTDSTTAINNAIAAANTNGGGVVYFPKGTFLISAALALTVAGVSLRGAGKNATLIKRANATNLRMVTLVGATDVTIEHIGFDMNGANQTSNQQCIYYDATSHNLTVQLCRFINASGMVLITSDGGNPPARVNNLRVLFNDVIATAGVTSDLVVPVSSGGCTVGNNVNMQGGAGINVYESIDHPCFGNKVTMNNVVGATGIRCSSSLGSPIGPNSILTGGSNDTALGCIKETDNSGARAQTEAMFEDNTVRGGGIYMSISSASGIEIDGGIADACFAGINFNAGAIDQFQMRGVRFLAIGGGGVLVQNVVPTNVRIKDCPGYNPVGVVTPAVPASGVAVPATFYDRHFWISTGAGATTIAIAGGPTITLAASTAGQYFFVPAGQAFTPTFANAPTWVVEGN